MAPAPWEQTILVDTQNLAAGSKEHDGVRCCDIL